MAFAIPVVAAIITPTFLTVAAAALSVAGFVTGNKTLGLIGGLVGLGSAFAGGLIGGAGAAEGVGAAADSTAALESGLAAYSGPDYAAAIQSGADVTQLSPNVAKLAGDAVDNAALLGEGATGGTAGGTVGSAELPGAPAANKGVLSQIWDLFNSQGDVTKAGIVKVLGETISSGFKRNPQAEFVDLQRDKFNAEEAELARRRANMNNITGVNLNMRPNPNANLYPAGQYRPVGILQTRRA